LLSSASRPSFSFWGLKETSLKTNHFNFFS